MLFFDSNMYICILHALKQVEALLNTSTLVCILHKGCVDLC